MFSRVCNRRSPSVIVNASNWGNAIAASRNGERQKWMINTFLCAYGAPCMCKLISLSSSRAHVQSRRRTRNDSVLRLRDIGRHVVKHVPVMNRGSLLSTAYRRQDFFFFTIIITLTRKCLAAMTFRIFIQFVAVF